MNNRPAEVLKSFQLFPGIKCGAFQQLHAVSEEQRSREESSGILGPARCRCVDMIDLAFFFFGLKGN